VTGRAVRRHHRARLRARVQRLLTMWAHVTRPANVVPFEPDAKVVGMMVRTRRPCSCFVCSSRKRRNDGPTMRERRAEATA
jgi:hypothetical protein